jgi:hypothetical protein
MANGVDKSRAQLASSALNVCNLLREYVGSLLSLTGSDSTASPPRSVRRAELVTGSSSPLLETRPRAALT